MKNSILVAVVFLLVGALGGYVFSRSDMRGGDGGPAICWPNLTVARTDALQDGHALPANARNQELLGFRVTNHSSSSTYALNLFALYAGIENGIDPANVRNIKLYNDATLIARFADLYDASRTPSASTTPVMILPLSSQRFSVRADLYGPNTSTTTLRTALGNVEAHESTVAGPREPVYKETNARPVQPPTSPADESVESARLRY
ncbi:hypothetical protein EPO33_00050 [Patescibacteria group bacterium]|nr:MAG: hypothetical protein EPO33_00050 [Patescibacteria group bacterium]